MTNKRLTFELSSLSLIQDDKTFASLAEKYPPKEGISYIGFTFHGSTPLINMKAMSITPTTMQASIESAIDCMVDYEHRAEDIPIPREDDDNGTEIMGHIKELIFGEVPSVDDADAWLLPPYIPKEPVLTRGVMVFYTRIGKVRYIANEIDGGAPWYFSLEIGQDVTPPAIWLEGNDEQSHEIIAWADAPEDLRSIAGQPRTMEYAGRRVSYLMGGADGKVQFIGGAITRNPAGFEQRAPGNAMMFIASADGVIQDIKRINAVWTTAYINSLPDSSFAAIEGDNARHLPFIDVQGKVDLPHLRDALEGISQIQSAGSPETTAELRAKAAKKLESYRTRLQTRKEGDRAASVDGGIIVPINIETYDDLLRVYDMIDDIMKVTSDGETDTNTGGEDMAEVELTKKEYDEKVAAAQKAGYDEGNTAGLTAGAEGVLEKAVADGTHIAAEEVDTIVAKRVMSKGREAAIAALPCDDDTKADFVSIAGNEERYPLDEDGQKLFEATKERWIASLKPPDADKDDKGGGDKDKDKKGDDDKGKDDKKSASAGEGGKDFDPGNGGGGNDSDLPESIPQVG